MTIRRSLELWIIGHCSSSVGVKEIPIHPEPMEDNSDDNPGLTNMPMNDWVDMGSGIILNDARIKVAEDCGSQSGSLLEDGTIINEMVVEETASQGEFEDIFFDAYSKAYPKDVFAPINAERALSFLRSHAMPISDKVPKKGVSIERYSVGKWAFKTVAHAKKFRSKFNKVVPVLESLITEVR